MLRRTPSTLTLHLSLSFPRPSGTIYFNLANRADDYQGTRTLVAAIFMTAGERGVGRCH